MLCTPQPIAKCTKAAGREEARNDSELGDPSRRANPELPTRASRPDLLLAKRGFPGQEWTRGEGSPALQFLSRARGSPTPWAWATIPLTGPRPMRRSNLLGPEKEAPGGGSGRSSLRGLRAARQAALVPFLYTHRPAHAPTGAERARRQPTHDPYRPRGERRKPQSIRVFARARAIACASRADTSANWGRGLGPAAVPRAGLGPVRPRQGLGR